MIYPKLFIIPLIVSIIVFGIKIIIKAVRGNFRWGLSVTYGGMPSIHTAFVVSLSAVVAFAEGVFSVSFAVATIFSLIIIRDAVGYRRYIGYQSVILNKLIREQSPAIRNKFPRGLEETIGHTIPEAIVGGILGFILALMLYIIIP